MLHPGNAGPIGNPGVVVVVIVGIVGIIGMVIIVVIVVAVVVADTSAAVATGARCVARPVWREVSVDRAGGAVEDRGASIPW